MVAAAYLIMAGAQQYGLDMKARMLKDEVVLKRPAETGVEKHMSADGK